MMQKEYVYPFIEEFEAAVLSLSGGKVLAGRPYVSEVGAVDQGNLAAIIELSGEVQGAVAVSMNEGAAIDFADALLGTKHTSADDEVGEVIEELVNVFAGGAKKHFEKVAALNISLPIFARRGTFTQELRDNTLRYICVPYFMNEVPAFVLSVGLS
jgi:chemotaxis protein CheX